MKGTISKVKRQSSEWEKITANKATDKDLSQKYTSSSDSLIPEKEMTQSKNGPKNSTDISPKKTYRWLTNT